ARQLPAGRSARPRDGPRVPAARGSRAVRRPAARPPESRAARAASLRGGAGGRASRGGREAARLHRWPARSRCRDVRARRPRRPRSARGRCVGCLHAAAQAVARATRTRSGGHARSMSIRLETDRLVLRPPELGDVDDVLEFVGDEEVMRWIGGEAGNRDAAVESVERWIGRWNRNGVGQFAVLLDGHAIGRVGLLVWDVRTWETSSYDQAGEHGQTELGWALTRRHWGRGYATEAARAVRDWAYAERGLDHLI